MHVSPQRAQRTTEKKNVVLVFSVALRALCGDTCMFAPKRILLHPVIGHTVPLKNTAASGGRVAAME